MGLAKKVLGDYGLIWAMASGILLVLGAGVLTYSILSARSRWSLITLNADRAVELAMATLIVAMLLFVRYYRVPMNHLQRMLAISFCFYSCFFVINHSIYETVRLTFEALWNYLDMLTFTATLLLGISAVYRSVEVQDLASSTALAPELYTDLSQKLISFAPAQPPFKPPVPF